MHPYYCEGVAMHGGHCSEAGLHQCSDCKREEKKMLKVVLRGSHGGDLDEEEVRVNHRNPDRDISAAVVRLANRATLAEGDVITIEGER